MKAIKGIIGATPNITVTDVFSPQGQGSKEGAKGFPGWENDLAFLQQAFTSTPLRDILTKANSPVT
jgi:hypothetical protein